MVQLYQFQGQEYQFPDGVTEDEVLQFLQSQQPGPPQPPPAEEQPSPDPTQTRALLPDTADVDIAGVVETDDGEFDFFGQLGGSFWQSLTGENPKLFYRTIEGMSRNLNRMDSDEWLDGKGVTSGRFNNWVEWAEKNADEEENNPENFKRKVHSFTEIFDDDPFLKNFQDAVNYVGGSIGQGLGSLLPIIAGRLAGTAVGTALGAGVGSAIPVIGTGAGAKIGAIGGALVGGVTPSFIMNYGDTYDYLVKQQGVDKNTAALYATVPGAIMAGLDYFGANKIISLAFKNEIKKKVLGRIATAALKGGTVEGITETAQQIVQEVAGELSEKLGFATKDVEFGQRFENIINSTIQGFLTGKTTSGGMQTVAEGIRKVIPQPAQPDPSSGDNVTDEQAADQKQEVVDEVGEKLANASQAPLTDGTQEPDPLQIEYQAPLPGTEEIVTSANPVDVVNSMPEEELAIIPEVDFAVDQTDQGFRVVSIPDGFAITPTFRTMDEAELARQRLYDRVIEDQETRDQRRTEQEASSALKETKQKETTALLNTAKEVASPYEPIKLKDLIDAVGQEKASRIFGQVTINTDKDRIYLDSIEEARQEIGINPATGELIITDQDMTDIRNTRQPEVAAQERADSSYNADSIIKEAKARNIDTNDKTFKIFAKRVTGIDDVNLMNTTQRVMLKDALDRLNDGAPFEEKIKLPILEAPPYSREDFAHAVHRIRHSDEWVADKKPRKEGSKKVVPNKNKTLSRKKLDELIKGSLVVEEEVVDEVIFDADGEPQPTGRKVSPITGQPLPKRKDSDVVGLREELVRRGIVKGVGKKRPDGSYNQYSLPVKVGIAPTLSNIEASQTMDELREETKTAQVRDTITANDLEKIARKLKNTLRKRGLGNVGLRIAEALQSGAQGEYVNDENGVPFILLALDKIPEEARGSAQDMGRWLAGILDHESIHALAELGVLNEADVIVLRQAVEQINYVNPKTGEETGETYLEWARRMYLERYTKAAQRIYSQGSVPQQSIDEMVQEEAIAEMFRGYTMGLIKLKGRPRTIWQKIVGFFQSLTKVKGTKISDGRVIEQAHDIFSGIVSGEVGKKQKAIDAQKNWDALTAPEKDEGADINADILNGELPTIPEGEIVKEAMEILPRFSLEDTQVVNENGEPLVVYHATDVEIVGEFKNPQIGFHFAVDEALARNAAIKGGRSSGDLRVEPVYLDMQNVVEITGQQNGFQPYPLFNDMLDRGYINEALYDEAVDRHFAIEESLAWYKEQEEMEQNNLLVREIAGRVGIDGFRYMNEYDAGLNIEGTGLDVEPGISYIALNPNQIISARVIEESNRVPKFSLPEPESPFFETSSYQDLFTLRAYFDNYLEGIPASARSSYLASMATMIDNPVTIRPNVHTGVTIDSLPEIGNTRINDQLNRLKQESGNKRFFFQAVSPGADGADSTRRLQEAMDGSVLYYNNISSDISPTVRNGQFIVDQNVRKELKQGKRVYPMGAVTGALQPREVASLNGVIAEFDPTKNHLWTLKEPYGSYPAGTAVKGGSLITVVNNEAHVSGLVEFWNSNDAPKPENNYPSQVIYADEIESISNTFRNKDQIVAFNRELAQYQEDVTYPVEDVLIVREEPQTGRAIPKRIGGFSDSIKRYSLPDATAQLEAAEYKREKGIVSPPLLLNYPIMESYLQNIADTYESLSHNPDSPDVQIAYEALIEQTIDQYRAIGTDLRIEPWTQEGEPYRSSEEMLNDVRENRHLFFFLTDNGYGEGDNNLNHPMLEESEFRAVNGVRLLNNDIFRIVHDYFGHAPNGLSFGPVGEFNAFMSHATMYTPQALPALAMETLAQNAWVNFGPHIRRVDGSIPVPSDEDYIPQSDRPFAEQKANILPDYLLPNALSPETSNQRTTRHVPSELVFGTGAPYESQFPGYYDLSPEGQASVTRKVTNKIYTFVEDMFGVKELSRIHATGGWMNDNPNPNVKANVLGDVEAVRDVMRAVGYLQQQTEVMGYKIFGENTPNTKLGAVIVPKGNIFKDSKIVNEIWQKLHQAYPDLFLGYSTHMYEDTPSLLMLMDRNAQEVHLLQEAGQAHRAVQMVAEDMGIDLSLDSIFYRTESVVNDWQENPNGESYIQGYSEERQSAIVNRLDNFKQQQLEPTLSKEITRQAERDKQRRDVDTKRIDKQSRVDDIPPDAYKNVPRNLGLVRETGQPKLRDIWGFVTANETTFPVYVKRGYESYDDQTGQSTGFGWRHIIQHEQDFEKATIWKDWRQALALGLDSYNAVRKRKKILTGSVVKNEQNSDEFKIIREGEKFKIIWSNKFWKETNPDAVPITIVLADETNNSRIGKPIMTVITAFPSNEDGQLSKDQETEMNLVRLGMRDEEASPLADSTLRVARERLDLTGDRVKLTKKGRERPVLKLRKYSLPSETNEATTELVERYFPKANTRSIGDTFIRSIEILSNTPFNDWKSWAGWKGWFRQSFVNTGSAGRFLDEKVRELLDQETSLTVRQQAYIAWLNMKDSVKYFKQAWGGKTVFGAELGGVPNYNENGIMEVVPLPEDATQTDIYGQVSRSPLAGERVGLMRLFAPLVKGRESKIALFQLYAVARRSVRLLSEGKAVMGREAIIHSLRLAHTNEEVKDILDMAGLTNENGAPYTLDEIASIGGDITPDPVLNEVFTNYQTYNGYVVQFLIDSGVITEEMGEVWMETADYIPYYRQIDMESSDYDLMSEEKMLMPGVRPPLELKGGGEVYRLYALNKKKDGTTSRDVIPVDFPTFEEADRYRDTLIKEGVIVEEPVKEQLLVENFIQNVSLNLQSAIQTGLTNIMYQRMMKNMITVYPDSTLRLGKEKVNQLNADPKRAEKIPYITFRVNGEDVTMTIPDRIVASAFAALNYRPNRISAGILGTPAKILRELVTRSIDFIAKNMIRDTLSAFDTTGAGGGKTGLGVSRSFIPGISTLINFVKAIRPDLSKTATRMAETGVMTAYDYAGDPSDAEKAIKKAYRKEAMSSAERLLNPMNITMEVWEGLGELTVASDMGTRMAVYEAYLNDRYNDAYKAGIEQYGSGPNGEAAARADAEQARIDAEPEAIVEAKEVINFASRGQSKALRYLTIMIPFLNARIQGLDVLIRSGVLPFTKGRTELSRATRQRIKRTAMIRGMVYLGAAIGYAMLVADDDEYENQNQEVKDTNLIIPSKYIPGYDGPPIKIPKPFEIGLIFMTVPERIFRYMTERDTAGDLKDSMMRGIRTTFKVDWPQFMLPLMETIFGGEHGWSSFTQRPLETGKPSRGAYWRRFNNSTSEIAKDLGKLPVNFENPNAFFLPEGISPIKIDHLVKSYLGTLGIYGYMAVDELYKRGKSVVTNETFAPTPEKPWHRMPILRSFFADPLARGAVNEFWALNKLVTETIETAEGLASTIKPYRDEYIISRSNITKYEGEFKNIREQLGEIRKAKERLRDNINLSGSDKRVILEQLIKKELSIVKEIGRIKKDIQKPVEIGR